jgi:o-succinylbenzoate synthase
MYRAEYIKFPLTFLSPAGTSRGVLLEKDSWFIRITDTTLPGIAGIGECSLIAGLSPDNIPGFEQQLKAVCRAASRGEPTDPLLRGFPSIQFGMEMALLDLKSGGNRILFPSDFTSGKRGIPINGLIWMGNREEMLVRISEKLEQGFSILKMKVGALDFQDELEIIASVRKAYNSSTLELRLDANGAWGPADALNKLQQLEPFNIHSVEQPIVAGMAEEMAEICVNSPVPVALDEELTGLYEVSRKAALLEMIKPQYIILKPSLTGGFGASMEWIGQAEKLGIGWWITSALESNVGLNAISQWTATLNTSMPQGLGTGALFSNNFQSPLTVQGDQLFHLPENGWNLSNLEF